ncbi:MAG TPA: calcium-binding protein [Actinomycetota bacterium]|nr:calcium-binding protein [Actinomycetota bacterium]
MEKSRHPKLWGVIVACTVLGLFALTATPTQAHVPPDNNTNFNPDEHNGEGDPGIGGGGQDTKEAEILADHEDGFGTTYELRAVADSQAVLYEWYDCDDGANPTAAGPACQLAATDPTPDPAPAPPAEGTAASFSASYDIPQASNSDLALVNDEAGPGGERDIYGFACNDNTPGPPANTAHCLANDVVPTTFEGACAFPTPIAQSCVADVHVDNAHATGDHAATTNGRIQVLLTPSNTFTHPNVHGAGLKNGEAVTVIAFTSAGGVDAVHVCLDQFSDDETPNDLTPDGDGGGCTHNGTDTSPTPGGGSGCHASAPTAAGGDCWAVPVGVPIQNTVFGVSLIEIDDEDVTGGGDPEGATFGTGDCAGSTDNGDGDDCQLDKIYVTTTAAGEAVVGPPPPPPPPPPGGRVRTGLCNRNRSGANGNEILIGTNGPDQICGFGGKDTLRGKGGPDTLRGGGGKDVLAGGGGRDNARGGGGKDSLRGGKKADTLKGGGGKDSARGGPGNDLCVAEIEKSC